MDNKSFFLQIISWLFGIIVLAIGVVNTFWGNDPFFGIFLTGLSFLYFPPVTALIRKWLRIPVPGLAKILLGLFIIWASLGVGELFDKIHLMLQDFR